MPSLSDRCLMQLVNCPEAEENSGYAEGNERNNSAFDEAGAEVHGAEGIGNFGKGES